MKNQYFGDVNDFFKYDLCIYLAEAVAEIERFTFIPLLTPDDGSSDGSKVSYRRGVGRPSLHKFLLARLGAGDRRLAALRDYFEAENLPFEYCPYGDDLSLEFVHEERDTYFELIPDDYLQRSMILLDPDNGIEVPSARPKTLAKFVLWSEIEDVYHRMDEHSVLALYQHLPRVHRKTHIYSTHAKLQELLKGPLPVSVSDNAIAFILITKTRKRQKLLTELLGTYLKNNFALYD